MHLLLRRVLRHLTIPRGSTSWSILNDLCEGLQGHLSDADALKEGMGTLAHHLPLLPAPGLGTYGVYDHPARRAGETAHQIWTANADSTALRVQALMLWHQGLAMLGPSSFVDKECFVAALESMLSSPGEGQMMLSCVWTYEILHACVHHTVALVAQKRALVVITSLFFRVAGCDEILPLLDVMVKWSR